MCTEGDTLAETLAEVELAHTVPTGNVDLLAEVILAQLAGGGAQGEATGTALQALRAQWHWERLVEPIFRFLEHNAFASDAMTASRTAAQTRQVEAYVSKLETQAQQKDEVIRCYEEELSQRQAVIQQQQEDLQRVSEEVNRLTHEVRYLEQQREELKAHIEEIAQGRVMRFLRAVDILLKRD